MSECTCSFRFKREYILYDPIIYCGITNEPKQCNPDTCTLWQDHLRIEVLEKACASQLAVTNAK